MKRLFIALIMLASCSVYTPPKEQAIHKTDTFNQSLDDLWEKAIKYFASKNYPIKSIDKNSGVIYSEFDILSNQVKSTNNNEEPSDLCKCGKPGEVLYYSYPTCTINLYMKKISYTQTQVTINALFKCRWTKINDAADHVMQLPTTGYSTGKLEQDIFEHLK